MNWEWRLKNSNHPWRPVPNSNIRWACMEYRNLWEHETKEEFLARIKASNNSKLLSMKDAGLFFDVDLNTSTPIDHPIKISLASLPRNATMAHVVSHPNIQIMPSVTQARKNGWDKPITLGIHSLTKKKILVEITE